MSGQAPLAHSNGSGGFNYYSTAPPPYTPTVAGSPDDLISGSDSQCDHTQQVRLARQKLRVPAK